MVTGGGSGLGFALASALCGKGVLVVIADIDTRSAKSAERTLRLSGGEAFARRLDVTRPADSEKLVAWVIRQFGRLDYFFNNAGVSLRGETRDLARADWDRLLSVNFIGAIHAGNAAFKAMAEHGGGAIINIASASAFMPLPGAAPYSTSKFGILGYSENLRIEGADLGIRVTAVCPGFIRSNIRNNPAVNVPQKESFAAAFREMPAEEAARRILAGIERNPSILIFPYYVRLLRWLHFFFPAISSRIALRMMRKFRALRKS